MLRNALFACLLFATQSIYAAFNSPIDVVYTWVDGSDEAWIKNRTQWMVEEHMASPDGASVQRFRNRDELRYSMRSVFRFAPFVRKIFIVTNGQVPKWLKAHPKVQVVTHEEIFLKSNDLPTFNSMAIECNLHRIPGLSEHYLYFNDDVFLGRDVSPSDFFTSKGKMRLFFSKRISAYGPLEMGENGYTSACKNTNNLLNGLYKNEKRYQHSHTPYPLIKMVVRLIEQQFFYIFQMVASHRFRSMKDYTITNGLIPYVALKLGYAETNTASTSTVSFGRDLNNDVKKLKELSHNRPMFFCIQDASSNISNEQELLLSTFLDTYYPTPAPWELQ